MREYIRWMQVVAVALLAVGALAGEGRAASLQTLYAFAFVNASGHYDGQGPVGPLLQLNGTFYGNARLGGDYGDGVVFSLTPSGAETVLHSYNALDTRDGALPNCGFTLVNGALYAVTESGGANAAGAIVQVTPTGSTRAVFSFDQLDGQQPVDNGGLAAEGNTVVATSPSSIGYPEGSVVSYATDTGNSAVLWNFNGPGIDEAPFAGPSVIGTTVYGVTEYGGKYGYGSVFAITADGTFKTLHSFTGGLDGSHPVAHLTVYNHILYGVTPSGGANSVGVAFSVTRSGKFTKLYDFGTPVDNGTPGHNGLVMHNGLFYGLLYTGGTYGVGMIYTLSPTGSFTPLYSFGTNATDPFSPVSEMTFYKGKFYGVASRSGKSPDLGAIFVFTP